MKQIYVVLALLAVILFSCDRAPRYPQAPYNGFEVVIPADTLAELTPRFYSITIGGKSIQFFVMRKDGEVFSFFDACKECYSKKLGFQVDDGYIMCRSCNVRYPIDAFMRGIGNCYPIRLEGRTENGQYRIAREALEKGAVYF